MTAPNIVAAKLLFLLLNYESRMPAAENIDKSWDFNNSTSFPAKQVKKQKAAPPLMTGSS
jgi:hypothetical protein